MKQLVLALALLAGGCASDHGDTPYVPPPDATCTGGGFRIGGCPQLPGDPMNPTLWEVGPIDYPGGNPSRGVPLHPLPHPAGGWYIDIPALGAGSANYVTMPSPPLHDKTRIVMEVAIELAPGARIVPVDLPQLTGMLTPYFQRAGDTWNARGEYEAYRWYSPIRLRPMEAGTHTLEARFDQNWTAVLTSSAASNPFQYDAARANASRVGFVLGGGNGVGHGVAMTGGAAARLIVKSYRIE